MESFLLEDAGFEAVSALDFAFAGDWAGESARDPAAAPSAAPMAMPMGPAMVPRSAPAAPPAMAPRWPEDCAVDFAVRLGPFEVTARDAALPARGEDRAAVDRLAFLAERGEGDGAADFDFAERADGRAELLLRDLRPAGAAAAVRGLGALRVDEVRAEDLGLAIVHELPSGVKGEVVARNEHPGPKKDRGRRSVERTVTEVAIARRDPPRATPLGFRRVWYSARGTRKSRAVRRRCGSAIRLQGQPAK